MKFANFRIKNESESESVFLNFFKNNHFWTISSYSCKFHGPRPLCGNSWHSSHFPTILIATDPRPSWEQATDEGRE